MDETLLRITTCLAILALFVGGCDGELAVNDAGARDAGAVDAGAVAAVDSGGDPFAGRITYARRGFGPAGLGVAVAAPAAFMPVALLEDDVEIATTLTDADGDYSFAPRATSGALEVRVLTVLDDPEIWVTDFMDYAYAFRGALGDLHVTSAELAGALAILETMRDGLEVARTAFERSEAFPLLGVYWERGRATPGGTSYASGTDLWILGGPNDTDEYDTPVLLHELGHYLQEVYSFSDTPDGEPHAGADTDPRLAWNEGWPSFFAAVVRDDPFYGDTIDGDISLALDLSSLPRDGEYVASSSATMTQPLSEWIIAGSLYQLYAAGSDPLAQLRRSFAPLTGWMNDPANDRGVTDRDLVDYLDGYLCLNGGADRAVVESYVIAERGFPYDLAAPCPKPGRRRAARSVWPAPVWLPGRLTRDGRGRPIREIRVSM